MGDAQNVQIMFRPSGVYENAYIRVMDGEKELIKQKKRILTPGEMAELILKPEVDQAACQRRGRDRFHREGIRRQPVMEQQITCINCPVGCRLQVVLENGRGRVSVSGNSCKRGEYLCQAGVHRAHRAW